MALFWLALSALRLAVLALRPPRPPLKAPPFQEERRQLVLARNRANANSPGGAEGCGCGDGKEHATAGNPSPPSRPLPQQEGSAQHALYTLMPETDYDHHRWWWKGGVVVVPFFSLFRKKVKGGKKRTRRGGRLRRKKEEKGQTYYLIMVTEKNQGGTVLFPKVLEPNPKP